MKKIHFRLSSKEKNRFSLLFLLLILIRVGTTAQVTIGTGVNTQNFPFSYYYGYARTASIYTASEMLTTSAGGTITTISWYSTVSSTTTGPTIIYLKQVGNTTAIISTTWATTIAGATQVYSGTPPTWNQGWNTIDITNYPIAANQNVEVLVECNYGGTGIGTPTSTVFRYSAGLPSSNANWQSSFSAPTGTPAASSGTIDALRPNVILAGLTPPPCPFPSAVSVGVVAVNTASVSFSPVSTGSSYVVEYGPAGFTPGTGATAGTSGSIVTATSSPTTISGLAAATTYDVYVRQNCTSSGNGYSMNAAKATFTTTCVPVTSFFENFDANASLPVCFRKVGTGGLAQVLNYSASSSPNTLYLYSSTTASQGLVALPPVSNAGAGTNQLRFKLRGNNTAGDTLQIGYLTNVNDSSSFTVLSQQRATSLTYTEYVVQLGTAPGANQYLALRAKGAPGYSMLIDDIYWETIPACPIPLNVAVGSIGTTSASVSFTPTGTGSGFVVEYGPVGFIPGTGATAGGNGTIVSGSGSPITISSLVPNTTYQVYVRKNCTGAGNGYSPNSSVTSFTTVSACATPTSYSISAVTSSSATVNFTPSTGNFIVEYGLRGFEPGLGATAGIGGTVLNATTSPVTITGLTPSTWYFVYMRQNCAASGNGYSFNVQVDSLFTLSAPPPANDIPSGAIAITVGAGCSGSTYTNAGATKATNEPGVTCSGSQTTGKSVWFKFIAPASGFVRVSTDVAANTLADTKMALYSATSVANYNTFQIIGCDDDNGVVSSAASVLYATGLTPSQYYYVVVDDYNGTATGNFCLRVDEATTAMIADTGLCTNGQLVPKFRADYKGWASLTNANGQLVANIRSTANLPNVVSYRPFITIRTGSVRQSATGEYYLSRNYSIYDTLRGNYDVQFFLLNTELAALQSVVPSATLAGINVTRVKNGTACSSDFDYGNSATDSLLLQTASGSAGGVSWVVVNTNGFSNFYLHPGTTQLSRLYVFTGNGLWSNPANWSNSEVPPTQLPLHSAIEIKPVAGGQCILDVPQRIPAGSSFRVMSGTNIVIPGSILVQ